MTLDIKLINCSYEPIAGESVMSHMRPSPGKPFVSSATSGNSESKATILPNEITPIDHSFKRINEIADRIDLFCRRLSKSQSKLPKLK